MWLSAGRAPRRKPAGFGLSFGALFVCLFTGKERELGLTLTNKRKKHGLGRVYKIRLRDSLSAASSRTRMCLSMMTKADYWAGVALGTKDHLMLAQVCSR